MQGGGRLSDKPRHDAGSEINMVRLKNRALFISLAASGLWHLLWVSVITVVIVPENIKAVKFSKVSFLGPVISAKALDVRTASRAASFLEGRMAKYADSLSPGPTIRQDEDFKKDSFLLKEDESLGLIMGSLQAEKAVPPPAFYSE